MECGGLGAPQRAPRDRARPAQASGDLYVIGGSEGFDTVYRLRLYRAWPGRGGDVRACAPPDAAIARSGAAAEMVWDVATCTGMRPSPRHQFSCTVAGNPDEDHDSVYIFGGGASGGQLYNDTFVLDVCAWGGGSRPWRTAGGARAHHHAAPARVQPWTASPSGTASP